MLVYVKDFNSEETLIAINLRWKKCVHMISHENVSSVGGYVLHS